MTIKINMDAMNKYADNLDLIDMQLDEIRTLVMEHKKKYQSLANTGDYGYAGDLEHVNELLAEVVSFLEGYNSVK